MTSSEASEPGTALRRPFRRLRTALRAASRYDLLLACIPAAFAVSALSSVSAHGALTAASLIGAVAIVDGMFRRPPRLPEGA
jgi:hypothetical protein